MTSTLSNPLTPDAIQLGDTVVQLQSLVEAYSTVLNQAKQQLEQLELTPEQLRRVEDRAYMNINLERFAYRLTDDFQSCSASGSDHQKAYYYLLDVIARKVTDRIADVTLQRFRDEIHSIVADSLDNAVDRFKSRADSYFNGRENRRISSLQCDNDEMRRTLRRVLNQAFAPEELNGMAAIAIHDEPTTNQENA
jgi:hypothetical protein